MSPLRSLGFFDPPWQILWAGLTEFVKVLQHFVASGEIQNEEPRQKEAKDPHRVPPASAKYFGNENEVDGVNSKDNGYEQNMACRFIPRQERRRKEFQDPKRENQDHLQPLRTAGDPDQTANHYSRGDEQQKPREGSALSRLYPSSPACQQDWTQRRMEPRSSGSVFEWPSQLLRQSDWTKNRHQPHGI